EEMERLVTAQDLAGERILVTAGPTQEAIDPVRFVSNRSSGKMGFAIARAAAMRGAEVRMVAGPSVLATPRGVERIDTVSAAEMLSETARNFPWCTALVMAAAVADFRPAEPAGHKVKKNPRGFDLGRASAACGEEGLARDGRVCGRDQRSYFQRPRQAQAQGARPDRRQRCDPRRGGVRRRYQYRYADRRRRLDAGLSEAGQGRGGGSDPGSDGCDSRIEEQIAAAARGPLEATGRPTLRIAHPSASPSDRIRRWRL